jgi:flavin reductase (DIM6/NTAB) family NADH-FMN oxidoreductase RutF
MSDSRSSAPAVTPLKIGLLKEALAAFPTGVTVITAADADDTPLGMTANAFCAVSVDPAFVLVCVNQSTRTHETLVQRQRFGVNILSEAGEHISNHCARPGSDKRLEVGWLVEEAGSPHLKDASAFLDCAIESCHTVGTHSVIIGRVLRVVSRTRDPLIYYRGAYRRFS